MGDDTGRDARVGRVDYKTFAEWVGLGGPMPDDHALALYLEIELGNREEVDAVEAAVILEAINALRERAAIAAGYPAAIPPQPVADEWQPIETAPKIPRDGEFSEPTIRLWDGKRERHGRWDTNQDAKRPKPYWRYSDSLAVTDDRAHQPTHWMPLADGPSDRSVAKQPVADVLTAGEREHIEACRRHLEVGAEIRSLSGQRVLLAIIDRLAPKEAR